MGFSAEKTLILKFGFLQKINIEKFLVVHLVVSFQARRMKARYKNEKKKLYLLEL